MFKTNEGKVDRIIRLVVGLVFLMLGFFVFSGILRTVFFVIAFLGLFTGLTGFCLIYKLLGINTRK